MGNDRLGSQRNGRPEGREWRGATLCLRLLYLVIETVRGLALEFD